MFSCVSSSYLFWCWCVSLVLSKCRMLDKTCGIYSFSGFKAMKFFSRGWNFIISALFICCVQFCFPFLLLFGDNILCSNSHFMLWFKYESEWNVCTYDVNALCISSNFILIGMTCVNGKKSSVMIWCSCVNRQQICVVFVFYFFRKISRFLRKNTRFEMQQNKSKNESRYYKWL